MVPETSRQLLELLLDDEPLTLDELTELVLKGPREDLFVDYKDGDLLDDRKAARLTIRQWVSGFANADGGVLVLGFDQPRRDDPRPRQLAPCVDRVGGEDLPTWASKCLAGMEGFFSPPPRFRSIPTGPGREVLVIAVARAPQIVPCYDAGVTRYFLRFHDSTPEVPAYLISDLILGRRQHPVLAVTLRSVKLMLENVTQGAFDSALARLSFVLSIENASLVPADAVDVGLVLFCQQPGSIWSSWRHPVTAHLRQYFEVAPPSQPGWELVHLRPQPPLNLNCFTSTEISSPVLQVPRWRTLHPHTPEPEPSSVSILRSALYLAPKGSPPSWFELRFTIPAAPRRIATNVAPVLEAVVPMLSGRPLVAWQVHEP